MIRAFFDTNVLVSAILKPDGSAGLLLRCASAGVFELLVSRGLLQELSAVLKRPKIRKVLGSRYSDADLTELVTTLADAFLEVGELQPSGIELSDPRDAHIIDAAMTAGVSYLVSGDKQHVLAVKDHPTLRDRGVKVVSISEFTELLGQRSRE